MKTKLKKLLLESTSPVTTSSIKNAIRKILFNYRTTPLSCCGTPAELHVGRVLKTKLHLLQSRRESPFKFSQPKTRVLQGGERVLSRNYYSSERWKKVTVIKRFERVFYSSRLNHGYVIKRHINQLCSSEVSPTEISSEMRPLNFSQ